MWKLIVLFLILILFTYLLKTIFRTKHTSNRVSVIQPYSTVVQTTKTIETVPKKVAINWEKFAPEFERKILNDDDCIEFLNKFYGKRYVDKFKNFKTMAFKADLFRYAWLYVHGGVYCDIKTVLIKDLKRVFPDKNKCYMVYSTPYSPYKVTSDEKFDPDSSLVKHCYNGIIATPPKNAIMLDLLESCMETNEKYHKYHVHVENMYKIVKEYCASKSIEPGLNKTVGNLPNIHFYIEKSFNIEHCNNTRDRYGLCMFVVDHLNNEKIMKIRYNDYPWS